MRIDRFIKQFNWRFLLVRILVNALALAVTAAVTPKIYFIDKSLGNWLLMALMLGVLNALLKPLLQFLTLQFIFVTYGLVVVLVNALLLWLLSLIFPARFAVENFWWLLVGGLVLGLFSSFLESLLGLTMPIVPDELPEVRHRVEEQSRQAAWLATAGSEEAAVEAVPAGNEAAEASTPGLEETPPAPVEVEIGPRDSVETAAREESEPAEAGDLALPAAEPQVREEEKGDRP